MQGLEAAVRRRTEKLQTGSFTSLFGHSYSLCTSASTSQSLTRPTPEWDSLRERVGIASLPVELLSLIFSFLSSSARVRRLPIVHYTRHIKNPRQCDCDRLWVAHFTPHETLFPYAHAKVCRNWRDILSTHPSFWTRVVVSRIPGEHTPPERLAQCLRWSRDLPIEVYIGGVRDFLRHPDERTLLQAYTDVLRPHFHRCLSICYDVEQPASLPPLEVNKEVFPLLKDLVFKIQQQVPPESLKRLQQYMMDICSTTHIRPSCHLNSAFPVDLS